MSILENVSSPADIRGLSFEELDVLAAEIREFLVHKVSATGGHLGPNLGVVELTLAIHRVFDSPTDPILFDTGHQAYVHKILTGRKDQFDTLRQKDGLSGYPSRAESPHDWLESSHASAALSQADGLAKAFEIHGQTHRHIAVLVGDGALTGGMCWEALNNIAEGKRRSVVIVVNDNGRSYAPTIGGLAHNLAALRLQPAYDFVMEQGKQTLGRMGWVGDKAFQALRGVKAGVRHTVIPHEMFSDLGLKYIGPVDGHNVSAVENALRFAKDNGGPVIVHTVTQKGRGYAPAENHKADQMHGVGVLNPETGKPLTVDKPGWTAVFADELIALGRRRPDIVAITAAMAGPTGVGEFGAEFPSRMFDVGIAEQHAIASAAGLALGGLHPVVAVYATFLNRAFDQLLMDAALIKQPVTVVLDRAGITGTDGASHNGVWDLAVCGIIPGVRIAAPRDAARLRQALREAVEVTDGPTVVRFPKGGLPQEHEAIATFADDPAHIIVAPENADFEAVGAIAADPTTAESGEEKPAQRKAEPAEQKPAENVADAAAHARAAEATPPSTSGRLRVLVLAIGPFVGTAVDIAGEINADVTVVDPRWVRPVGPAIRRLADQSDLVVVWEDGVIRGGIGAAVREALHQDEIDTPVRSIAVPQKFLDHASRSDILRDLEMDGPGALRRINEWIAKLS